MQHILLTAFEPFGGETINPSWEMIKDLEGKRINNATIHCRCLPVVFYQSQTLLEQYLKELCPNIVLAFGQAGGRAVITPERIAINLDDARIPDNAGNKPCDTPVMTNAPDGYLTTLPIKAIKKELNNNGIACDISYTAGTFVCNHLFFTLQHLAKTYGISQSGFIHIPFLPHQAAHHKDTPSMSLAILKEAVPIIIKSVLTNKNDIKIQGGATH